MFFLSEAAPAHDSLALTNQNLWSINVRQLFEKDKSRNGLEAAQTNSWFSLNASKKQLSNENA